MVYGLSVHTIFAIILEFRTLIFEFMQIPILSEVLAGTTTERAGAPHKFPSGVVLSIQSQMKLRTLYQYVDSCRETLDEIQQDLVLYESGADGLVHLQRASGRLGSFCIEADSWGFHALYEIAHRLQMLLMNAGGLVYSNGFWEALQKGLAMLSALLEQCERDFRLRLAAADTLDAINQASGD
jgi:hypothetical protein